MKLYFTNCPKYKVHHIDSLKALALAHLQGGCVTPLKREMQAYLKFEIKSMQYWHGSDRDFVWPIKAAKKALVNL